MDASHIPTGNYYNKQKTKNPIERFLVTHFDKQLRKMFEKVNLSKTLEIGCGEGNNVVEIKDLNSDAHYTGTDIDHDLLEQTKEKGADDVIYTDPEKAISIKFPDNSFTTVMMVEVLEHLPDPELALKEAARLTSDQFIATVPLEPLWRFMNLMRFKYISDLGNTPGHINHWGRSSFRKLISRHFDIVECKIQLPWIMIRARKRTGE
ncbi:MAG: class I SAM-dependent methyltransferase [Leptospirales bacterium]